MSRFRTTGAIVLTVTALILILQNSAPVETNILFWTLSMPRAVLLAGTLLIGFALGVIATLVATKRSDARGSGTGG